VLIPTFSPQGDGNRMLVEQGYAPLWVLIPTFSPQGDGNEDLIGLTMIV